MKRLTGLLIALGSALACGDLPDAPSGFQFAYAQPTCGPADGPATQLYLSSASSGAGADMPPPRPYLFAYIDRPATELPGTTFTASQFGAGICEPNAAGCEQALDATVSFRGVRTDGFIEGTLDYTVPGRGRITGGFSAEPRPAGHILCG